MSKLRIAPNPHEVFLDRVNLLIKNLFIDNKNMESGNFGNGNNFSYFELKDDVKKSAEYLLKDIDRMKSLIENFPEDT